MWHVVPGNNRGGLTRRIAEYRTLVAVGVNPLVAAVRSVTMVGDGCVGKTVRNRVIRVVERFCPEATCNVARFAAD